jgi:hypothetical protein
MISNSKPLDVTMQDVPPTLRARKVSILVELWYLITYYLRYNSLTYILQAFTGSYLGRWPLTCRALRSAIYYLKAALKYREQCYVITASIIQPSRSELPLRGVFNRE